MGGLLLVVIMKKIIAAALAFGILILVAIYFSSSISSFLIKNQTPTDYRPTHCNQDGCIIPEVFSKLPKYPEDFKIDSVTLENETYFKQPEFYPTFEQNIFYYVNPPTDYLGFYGYGAFPSEGTYTRGQNQEVITPFLIYSSWYVIKYQGLKLNVLIDDSIKDYFDVTIDPDVVLLEPTFPVFENNWTQLVKMRVKIKNPPAGRYSIGVTVSPAPGNYSDLWYQKYGPKYTSGGFISLSQPIYKVTLNIQ